MSAVAPTMCRRGVTPPELPGQPARVPTPPGVRAMARAVAEADLRDALPGDRRADAAVVRRARRARPGRRAAARGAARRNTQAPRLVLLPAGHALQQSSRRSSVNAEAARVPSERRARRSPRGPLRIGGDGVERGLLRRRARSRARRRTSTRARSGASWRFASSWESTASVSSSTRRPNRWSAGSVSWRICPKCDERGSDISIITSVAISGCRWTSSSSTYHHVASRNWASSLSGRKRSGSRRKPVRLKISCRRSRVALVAGALAGELDLDQLGRHHLEQPEVQERDAAVGLEQEVARVRVAGELPVAVHAAEEEAEDDLADAVARRPGRAP